MKTAIVHDWLNGMRGGEKVLEALLELYPDSTIYTLFHERGKVSPRIEASGIITSPLNDLPGIYNHYRKLLPLFRAAVASFDLSEFDLVISSSHAVANWARVPNAVHVSYCHTPMRYLWDAEQDYAMTGLERMVFHGLRRSLRDWDVECSRRAGYFVANSAFVRERIRRYYGRDAAVIHPPVDTNFFMPASETTRSDFYLCAGALVPYKRVDVVVNAFNELGRRLVIAGAGPELKQLRQIAGPGVEFRGWVSDAELLHLYRSARAFVFAAREDFGMMPVEAMASGCPVLAFAAGGALETVRNKVSGLFFEQQSVNAIGRAVERFEEMSWPVERVRSEVEKFSRETFKKQIKQFIDGKLRQTPSPAAASRP